jgi:hypothetical protein
MGRDCKGGCQCGAVRYEVVGRPAFIYACHCTLCQRQSGSAFGMTVVFQDAKIEIAGVQPTHFVRPGLGRSMRCYFCPECGSRIYHQWFNGDGDFPFLNLKPGTLDDTSWLKPGCHMWTQHAQPGVTFSVDDVVFGQQPAPSEMPPYNAP